MADSQGSKGNPASKRMVNANLKAKRARSWLRGEACKKAHAAANEARRKANDEALRALGLSRTRTTIEVIIDGKKIHRSRPDSPQRTMRLAREVAA